MNELVTKSETLPEAPVTTFGLLQAAVTGGMNADALEKLVALQEQVMATQSLPALQVATAA